jgi:hypothetical protein
LIALIIVSCNNGKETIFFRENSLPYKIDVEKYYDNIKPVSLSTIGKDLVYVPLETRPDLVLGNVEGIAVYDSLIFINDSKQLYLFDIDGKFIRRIGSIGRGPGEYLLPYFAVDDFNRLVYVGGGDQINCFDFEGNDMGSFETDFYAINFIVNNDGNILFQKENYSTPLVQWPDSTAGWFITDGKGDVVSKIRSGYGNNFTTIPFLLPATMYRYDNMIHFKELFSDTLFYFLDDIKEPYAIFNYGKYWQDVSTLQMEDFTNKNATKILRVHLILEEDTYLFFKLYFSQAKRNLCIYNKKTGEMTLLEGEGFRNDIDGGIQFWPKFICDDGTLVDFCDAYTLLGQISAIESSGLGNNDQKSILKLKNVLDKSSNPVVILVKH